MRPALATVALFAAVPVLSGAAVPSGGRPITAVAAPRAVVASKPLYPLPAEVAKPEPCPPPPRRLPPGKPRPLGRPAVPETKVPRPVVVPARQVDLSAVKGTGEWVTVFSGGPIDSAAIVKQAVSAGLTSIWVRVGSTHEGFYGAAFLPALLSRAHAARLDVVGWDFATLSNPPADAHRAAVALAYTTPAGDRLDGYSGDIETAGEGTFLTARRVQSYFSRVQAAAGNRPVIATVLRPTDYWWFGPYPYHAEAPYVDAFAPMIYWSCTEPGIATAQAVSRLKSLGKAVHAVGQGYDMGDEGGRPGLPSGQETWRFLDVAARQGAVGASLYLYGQATRKQWQAVADYPWPTR